MTDTDDDWFQDLRTSLSEPSGRPPAESVGRRWRVRTPGVDQPGAVDELPPTVDGATVDGAGVPAAELAEMRKDLNDLRVAIAGLARRIVSLPSGETSGLPEGFEDTLLEIVHQAVRHSLAEPAGTGWIDNQVKLLEDSIHELASRVVDINVSSLARDRLEKDVHVESLAAAAEEVARQVERATTMQRVFAENVEQFLEGAADGDGEGVAWADVMLLAHELRSRVDDLQEQQRATMRDLTEWQLEIADQFAALKAELLAELRSERG